MKIGIADPPYIGCAHLYADQLDYAGEVDHVALVERLEAEFDGYVLHAGGHNASEAGLAPMAERYGWRKGIWVKGFAAFKKNVPTAYAWEPVYIKTARKPVVSKRLVNRDWIECSITLRRGLTGAKPEAVCHWAFELVGARPEDKLVDLFPGTGAVTDAFGRHADYLTPKGRRSAQPSIVKRVTGTVLGFALQEAKRQRELAETAAGVTATSTQASVAVTADAGAGALLSSAPSVPRVRLGSVHIKPAVSRANHWGPVRRLRAAARIEQTALLMYERAAVARAARAEQGRAG